MNKREMVEKAKVGQIMSRAIEKAQNAIEKAQEPARRAHTQAIAVPVVNMPGEENTVVLENLRVAVNATEEAVRALTKAEEAMAAATNSIKKIKFDLI